MCNLTDDDRKQFLSMVLSEMLSARDHIAMQFGDQHTTWLQNERIPELVKLRRKLSSEYTVPKVRLSRAAQ